MGGDLKQKFDRLISAFMNEDEENFSQSLFDAQDSYNKRTQSQIYDDMIQAHSILFGGHAQIIRSGFDATHPEESDSEKAYLLAKSMREDLMQNLNKDAALTEIYGLICANEEDVERVWECLFATATHHKTSIMGHKISFDIRLDEFFSAAKKFSEEGRFPELYDLQKEEEAYAQSLSPQDLYNYWLTWIARNSGAPITHEDKLIEEACGSSDFGKKFEYLKNWRESDNNFGYGHIKVSDIAESQREHDANRIKDGTTHYSTLKIQ